jgi:hypothetical protein
MTECAIEAITTAARITTTDATSVGFVVMRKTSPINEASIGLAQAFDALDCGRLTGPVGADDAEDLTLVDSEGHVLDRDLLPVPLVQCRDLDDLCAHWSSWIVLISRSSIARAGDRGNRSSSWISINRSVDLGE